MRTKTHKPTPAHMVEICERHLKRITEALPKQINVSEAPNQVISKEAAADIMAQYGFKPKRMGKAE